MYDILELNSKSLAQLREMAKEMKLPKMDHLKKQDIVSKILDAQASVPVSDTNGAGVQKEEINESAPVAEEAPVMTIEKTERIEFEAPMEPLSDLSTPVEDKLHPHIETTSGNGETRSKEAPLDFGFDTKPKPKEPAYNFDNIVQAEGVLEITPEGFGFLRSADYNYLNSPDDVY